MKVRQLRKGILQKLRLIELSRSELQKIGLTFKRVNALVSSVKPSVYDQRCNAVWSLNRGVVG